MASLALISRYMCWLNMSLDSGRSPMVSLSPTSMKIIADRCTPHYSLLARIENQYYNH